MSEPSSITETPRDAESVVNVRALNHWFGQGEARSHALKNNTLSVFPGEVVVMSGRSGSGKTTLLTLIGTLRTIMDGSVKVFGEELKGMRPHQYVGVRRRLGFIFQSHNLFSSLTALENVRMAMELKKQGSVREMNERGAKILEAVGLGHRIQYKPAKLSGGQRQRVAIARALVNHPHLILADEPTASLDDESTEMVVAMLRRRASEDGAAVMVVTHDERVLGAADRIVKMKNGQIILDANIKATSERCEALRHCELFKEFETITLTEVAVMMHRETFSPGEDVIKQGEAGDKFYVITQGSVDVKIRDASGVERAVAALHKGDFFGEKALVEDKPRSATVTARERVETYCLDKDEFRGVLEENKNFNEKIKKSLFIRQ